MTTAPTASKRLFLSYGREDDMEFVARVHNLLSKHLKSKEFEFFVWYDQEELLSRGMAFTDEIARAVEGSDVVLLFVGLHATHSEWVKREWLHALKYCIPVIPLIVVGDGEIGDCLTTYPHAIQSANAIDCRKHGEADTWNGIIDKLAQFLNADPLPLGSLHGVSALPQYYIERPQYLDALKGKLAIGDPTQPDRTRIAAITSRQEVAALQGIGGIGKTTLALAVCADCDVRRTFERIVFVSVGPDKGAEAAHILLHDVGAAFEPGLPLYQSLNEARVDLGGRLRGTRTLIVLDDVWQEGITDAFSFGGVDCRLLVTTRNKALVNDETQVDKLDVSESLALIATVLGTEADALPAACTRIVTTLDGHTLAVRIAAAWLKKFGLGRADKYAEDLTSADAFAHLQLGKDKNVNLEKSLTLSYEALEADDRARFRALGVLAPTSTFDLTLLAALWGVEDALYPAQALVDAALLTLTPDPSPSWRGEEESKVEQAPPTERYSLHPLLHTYARALISRPDEAEARETAFERYAEYVITLAEGFRTLPLEKWRQLDPDLPHVDYVGDELSRRYLVAPDDAALQDRMGRFAYNVTSYVFRRPQAVPTAEGIRLRGMNWLDMGLEVARTTGDLKRESLFLNELGLAWSALGEKQKALVYYQQALPLDRAMGDRGGEATTLSNIGVVWDALGEKRKALEYYEQALPLRRAVGD